jgi:hypothetical protein
MLSRFSNKSFSRNNSSLCAETKRGIILYLEYQSVCHFVRDGHHEEMISNCERFKLVKMAFAKRDKKQQMTDLRGISTNWFKKQLCPSTRRSRLRAPNWLPLPRPIPPPTSVSPPLEQKGGYTRVCGRGRGRRFGRLEGNNLSRSVKLS